MSPAAREAAQSAFLGVQEGAGEGGVQQGGVQQGSYAQLPYPWEQLADPQGNVYYFNAQTGVSQWEPPQQARGAWG